MKAMFVSHGGVPWSEPPWRNSNLGYCQESIKASPIERWERALAPLKDRGAIELLSSNSNSPEQRESIKASPDERWERALAPLKDRGATELMNSNSNLGDRQESIRESMIKRWERCRKLSTTRTVILLNFLSPPYSEIGGNVQTTLINP